jgi:hypothetical protein
VDAAVPIPPGDHTGTYAYITSRPNCEGELPIWRANQDLHQALESERRGAYIQRIALADSTGRGASFRSD